MKDSVPTKDVVVLSWKTAIPSDRNAKKIAEFFGADVEAVCLTACDVESIKRSVPACDALIVHMETLGQIAAELGPATAHVSTLTDLARHVFVYGYESTEHHNSILKILSSGSLSAIEPLSADDAAFRVVNTHPEWCGPFTGLSVGTACRGRDACFVDGAPHPEKAVLIQVAGRTFFAHINRGESALFFSACGELADLDATISGKVSLLQWFSRLVPLMMFLKKALGKRIWHSNYDQACLIIDDPLLKQRYGFLEYRKLTKSMEKHGFSTSIAFIPWNYRRSRKQIADLFIRDSPFLSICVHGCDHTGAEFAATSFELLCGKARLAFARMRLHNQFSGVPFDDVMVFPQGLFSSHALKALDTCGYLAAVSTDPAPSDMPQVLKLRHLLDVANTSFDSFPLFGRHYPRDVAEFAFDLFLGKPALVVEHHGYFQKGYEPLESFVRQMNALVERLEWSNLATVCSRACLKRVTRQGDVAVRLYVNRFLLTNDGHEAQTYLLSRQRPSNAPLPVVMVNGIQCKSEEQDDNLTFTLSLDPLQTADIRIVSGDPQKVDSPAWQPTPAYLAAVFTRRVLSEFRDNYVAKNRPLAAILAMVYKLRERNRLSFSKMARFS